MKLKMLKGLPASGKSTEARRLVDTGNHGRVNRDDLRQMVFNGVWSGHREGVIVEIEKAIADVLIRSKITPVIDDTNVMQQHKDMWSGFAKAHGIAFEMIAMDPGRPTCIERDSKRSKPVGEAIINRMALKSGQIDFFGLPIVLVDIDGTIADGKHREHHLKGTRKDWKTYYSLLSNDEPIDLVVRWVRELYKDHIICLVSGRPDTYQFETLAWLRKHNIPYTFIFMRAGSDKREDYIVKEEILKMLPRDLIQFAIDDRPQVIEKCWRANGIKVYPVAGACEPF